MEVENLLSAPDPAASPEEFRKLFMRKDRNYKDNCDAFREDNSRSKRYERQYSHIYFIRLSQMSTLVQKKAKEKWGEKQLKDQVMVLHSSLLLHLVLGTQASRFLFVCTKLTNYLHFCVC